MSLREAVEHALAEPGTVVVEVDGLEAEVEVVDLDRLGAVVRGIKVRGRVEDVGDRAEAVAHHLRPGGDHLVPVEVDRTLGGAVLRSAPSDVRGGGGAGARPRTRGYYEVSVSADAAELSGHQVDSEGRRSRIPFTWTRDQLGRSIDALERAMQPGQTEDD